MKRALKAHQERARKRLRDTREREIKADMAIKKIDARIGEWDDRREQIQEQIAELEELVDECDESCKALNEERSRCLWKKIDFQNQNEKESLEDAIEPCKAWNTLFCTSMHARLPRELRDMVYTQLWDEETLKETYDSMVRPLSNENEDWRCKQHRHFIKSEFVGPEVALEVVEAWYRLIPGAYALWHYGSRNKEHSDVFEANSLEYIERQVCHDTFSVGLNPARYIRQLNITLDMTKLVLSEDGGRYDSILRQRCLGSLLKIEKKSGFKLSITLRQSYIRLNLWPTALDILRPIVEVFDREGATVLLQFEYDNIKLYQEVLFNLRKVSDVSDWRNEAMACFALYRQIKFRHREYLRENNPDYVLNAASDTDTEYGVIGTDYWSSSDGY